MKEVELKAEDYRMIYERALIRFKNTGKNTRETEHNFLARCYVTSTVNYISGKGWVVKDGKILTKEKQYL